MDQGQGQQQQQQQQQHLSPSSDADDRRGQHELPQELPQAQEREEEQHKPHQLQMQTQSANSFSSSSSSKTPRTHRTFIRPFTERSKSHPDPVPQPASDAIPIPTKSGRSSAPKSSRRPSWLQFARHMANAGMSGLREEETENDHHNAQSASNMPSSIASSPENSASGLSEVTKTSTIESKRLSFSSLLNFGASIHGSNRDAHGPASTASSVKSVPLPEPSPQGLNMASAFGAEAAAASSSSSTAEPSNSQPQASSLPPTSSVAMAPPQPTKSARPPSSSAIDQGEWANLGSSVHRRSRSRTQRRQSYSTAASSTSPNRSDRSNSKTTSKALGIVGICALDTKARSKPSRNILTRLQNNGEFEIKVFGDKVILDEDVENWPLCDYLISFFSDGFPLDKAVKYAEMRKPFCVNDLLMQKVLWDRRLCLKILDKLGVPTPRRLEVNRDGGPRLDTVELVEHLKYYSGVQLQGPSDGTGGGYPPPKQVELIEDGDALMVDGVVLRKPFVEKPVSGEDHNVYIYFPKSYNGGGARRLFRKIGNKSSEWDSTLITPRCLSQEGSSYLYEKFIDVDNAEDVKAYTVGTDFCHAETRKSPVVDGLVQRNTHGKEIRYITALAKDEQIMASKIAQGFGQRICGFDLLRADGKSYVIDVNGWSFVKDNNEYYDKCAKLLKQMFVAEKERFEIMNGYKSPPTTEQSSPQLSRRPSNAHQHRQALKGLFKSPSLHKLHGVTHAKKENIAPGDVSSAASPISSPPTLDLRSNTDGTGDYLSEGVASASTPTIVSSQTPRPLRSDMTAPENAPLPASKHSWKLKGMVAVVRHADRTPKQKFKFTFHTQPFVDLLKGHQEEVLLKGEAALSSVLDAVKLAQAEGIEDATKLGLLEMSLQRKGAWTGTKVQIKPMFRKRKPSEMPPQSADPSPGPSHATPGGVDDAKTARSNSVTDVTMSRFTAGEEDLILDKLQLVIKWGGEPTHAARYQSQDLGENMRKDLLLMNRDILGDVRVFSSSERRVMTSAQIWAASFLDQKDIPDDHISVRKDLLDDSNAAKDVMDKVKKKLKSLLRQGLQPPPQFAWPANTPEPYLVVRRVSELMRFHRRVMRHNMNKLETRMKENGEVEPAVDPNTIQARWCCGENPELFKERWEKLFDEFADSEKVDPSKVSELYDTMKFDALHNRQFLEWVFTPSSVMLKEMIQEQDKQGKDIDTDIESPKMAVNDIKNMPASIHRASEVSLPVAATTAAAAAAAAAATTAPSADKHPGQLIADKLGLKKRSNTLTQDQKPSGFVGQVPLEQEPYFKLYSGSGQTRAKQDERLENLREVYKLAKVLYDFICPQEYGIEDSEKLEIGLLTSLPLLKEIVQDLEEVQASEDAKSFVYFTKESHVYTLLNAMLEGGLQTKIARNAIPELDYLSQIVFELYESEDKDTEEFQYSIRIAISPGCHTQDPLDLLLDSRHSISCAPRRTLTPHCDWKDVIETLRAKFHTVKLPKSFIAINLSEKHARDNENRKKVSGLKSDEAGEQDTATTQDGEADGDGTKELPQIEARGRRNSIVATGGSNRRDSQISEASGSVSTNGANEMKKKLEIAVDAMVYRR